MKQESMDQPAPYEVIKLNGEEILSRVQRFPTFTYGHDNLAQAFQAFSGITGLIFIAGLPRSGKSFAVNNLNYHVENAQIGSHNPHFFHTISWEEAEDVARKRGLITTPNELPFSNTELKRCNNVAKELISTSLDSFQLTTVEIPAIAYDQGKGRDLGTSTIDEIIKKRTRRFNTIRDYEVRGIGLVGGPLMQILMTYYRVDMKNSATFADGVKIAQAYGQAVPATPEIWTAMKHEGASFEQITKIEAQLDDLLDKLTRDKQIPEVSNEYVEYFYKFFIKNETDKLKLSPDLIKTVLKREIRTAFLTLYKFQNWNITSQNGGIFFNNPTIADLHIDQDFITDRITKPLSQ